MKAIELTKANVGDTIVVRGQVSIVDGETCGAFPVAFVQDGTPQAWLPANTEVDLVERPFKPDAGGWLPIESAPKDGTRMLLWHQLWSCGVQIGYYDKSTDWWRIGDDKNWIGVGIFPSHWKPLRAPPVATTTGAADAGSLKLSTDELIDLLTDDEGSTVTLCSKNVDFNGLPNELVIVNACWTDFKNVELRADTRNECLLLALATLRAAATVTKYLHALLPTGGRP